MSSQSYLESHARKYQLRKDSEPERALDCLQRSAESLNMWTWGQEWTPRLQSQIVAILGRVPVKVVEEK